VALAHGTLRTSPRTAHPQRLRALHDGIAAILAEHEVAGAALEAWFVHPVSRAAMGMAEARGAILVALAGAECPVREYAPTEIKKAVTGAGAADKAQVRAMVTRLCGIAPSSDHVADALAAAICDLHRAPLRAAIREAG
jgi:crossover junction endodeoxyribonuclease RuvC